MNRILNRVARRPKKALTSFRVFVAVCALTPAMSLAAPPTVGIFLGPPVPVESAVYEIEISSISSGPPLSVAQTSTVVNGNFVDTTVFLNHGSNSAQPAPFIAVRLGPLLAAGIYTFRYFTADKFPGDATYGPISGVLGSKVSYVAGAGNFAYAVEYYNAARNHYFMTAYASEIALLDGGHFPGWVRTAQAFRVYLTDPAVAGVPSGLSAVCRYYGLPEFGLDTHFFSATADECAAVQARWPLQWLLETSNAFYVYSPSTVDGSCPDGTVPVYRLYNNRPDANHRYTTSLTTRQQMIDAGSVPEGYGNVAVGMCVPPV